MPLSDDPQCAVGRQQIIEQAERRLGEGDVDLLPAAAPPALLDSRQLGAFMRELLEEAELPTEFSELQRALYVVACRLDTWERVVFSRETQPGVSIPDAVAASAAIPLLFRPVHINGAEYIDGGVKGTAAIDVAIDKGAKLIVVVNALVPLDVRGVRQSTYLHRFGNSIVDLGGISGADYDQVNLKKILENIFGSLKLEGLAKKVLIPSFDLKGTGAMVAFR